MADARFASLAYADCFACAFPHRRVERPAPRGDAAFAFSIDGEAAVSVLPIVPFDGPGGVHEDDLESIRRALAVSHLVFPLIYRDEPRTQALAALPGVRLFPRRPTAIIDWSRRGADVEERVRGKLGSLAGRRRRAFEKRGLTTRAIDDATAAVGLMAEVERRSWKASHAQDLLSTEQFALYASLVTAGVLRAIAVFDGDRPVAYRLDGNGQNAVICVQWSFDESYAKASPGFHLIATDLPRRYGDRDLAHIDLFGGEDLLKQLVMSGVRARVNAVYPDDEAARALVQPALERDQAAQRHLETRRGLRHLYSGEAEQA